MIHGVIFDLGSTLIRFTGAWETVNQAGAEAMATWYLKKKRIKLDRPALEDAFLQARAANWATAHQTQTEISATQSLQTALKKIEAPASAQAEAVMAAAIKIYFEPEEAAWQPYPDALDTLKQLHAQPYKLGLYSNATDDSFVQRLINRYGFRPWLSPTFSSAGRGWRKPKPEPFELIARRWNLPPQEIAVVGDTLQADILGAQNAGMSGILVTMDESPSNAGNGHIQPAAVAAALSDLPALIKQL